MENATSAEEPRQVLDELAGRIRAHLGDRLLGLYLFGSMTTGDFYAGRSDLDLIAVLSSAVQEGDDLHSLRALHETFESERPEWRDRIEVLYLSSAVLATFGSDPSGTVARISPGEPMHLRDLEGNLGWRLDWHGVMNGGETLFGPPPAEIGPPISARAFREGVTSQLSDMRDSARESQVAYVPAHQGYIAATISRCLYSLETGLPTSKAAAIEWAAERYPAYADYLRSAFAAYRADVRGPHRTLIDFADEAMRRSG